MPLLTADLAMSHARLQVSDANGDVPRLVTRNASDANKGGATTDDLPCGSNSLQRGDNPVVLVVGETITVDIEETINHTGTFQMNFSAAGQANFTELTPPIDDPNVPLAGGPNPYQMTFTVPNTPCTDCTIQFVQVMGVEPDASYYKSCVDAIVTTADAPPAAIPSGFAVSKGASNE